LGIALLIRDEVLRVIAIPHRQPVNSGTGSVAYGSGLKINNQAIITSRILQMLAVQQTILQTAGRQAG
jgi:hypothetical protein